MSPHPPSQANNVRTADVIATACLATDLGMGFPFEHGLKTTLTAVRLGRALKITRDELRQTYFTALLTYAGCTTDAAEASRIFGQSLTAHLTPVEHGTSRERLGGVLRALPPPMPPPWQTAMVALRRLPAAARYRDTHYVALCEVASMLAERFGLGPEIGNLLLFMTERWDGDSVLRRASGKDIPLPVRIVQVARDAILHQHLGGREQALDITSSRAGHAFDPDIAAALVNQPDVLLADTDSAGSSWAAVLEAEPKPVLGLDADELDRAVEALGNFADLVSPWLAGHSAGVAQLAERAAQALGMADPDVDLVRQAAHLQDLGRVAVDPSVWDKPGPLSVDEWEQVRLHAYHTERVLRPSEVLGSLAEAASSHHEHVDGGGYHRGVSGNLLTPAARLLAAADAFHAMIEPRAHRPAMTPAHAAATLAERARAGELDARAVQVVTDVAGEPIDPLPPPDGLTPREVEVLGLLARSLQTKQVAKALGISTKTADNHIQNLYRKIGVSSRAGATLYAMEHDLIAWGEHPIP